ncbi:unnamed protein product [Fusarium venenatum]|uniref:Uncharacterized protein n=1 Tax=Fusarium venenatum TaxID=56646 RepID=A0A2L2ST85_9HYPO|nr:uncharacterized protein FVRRES_04908 [Fusarium venenatum]CEI60472.1 unnamed protein product [Fusarium venenatum]
MSVIGEASRSQRVGVASLNRFMLVNRRLCVPSSKTDDREIWAGDCRWRNVGTFSACQQSLVRLQRQIRFGRCHLSNMR